MRIALAPINATIGDLEGNRARIETAIAGSRQSGADLVVLPELCVSGYPPRDLLFQEGFVDACVGAATSIGWSATRGVAAVIGTPTLSASGRGIANALMAFRDGEHIGTYEKRLLPTYDVFDEDRYFIPGEDALVIEVAGMRVGLTVCEDLWKGEDAGLGDRYATRPDPIAEMAGRCDLITVSSASPFVLGKHEKHRELLRRHARRHGVPIASVNQLGGNDDLIFDGGCWLVGPDGSTTAASRGFTDEPLTVDTHAQTAGSPEPLLSSPEESLVFRALRLGVKDYLHKTGFRDAIIGLSGGIDSALTAAVAVAALGAEHVTGVLMPFRYSSEGSVSDSKRLADRLGIESVTLPINEAFDGCAGVLNPAFAELGERRIGDTRPDIAEENLQSRVRGLLMMAVSNRTGAIVLTTGNKSEFAVGYCTLYGDMNGGLAVLSDVPKTLVYRVARWINAEHEACGFGAAPIPEGTIEKPPSAELAPDQKDSDALPPYEVLDPIIDRHVERRQSARRIVEETGLDRDLVERVCRLIDQNEYKRRQAAIGLKITGVAFGPGRRFPIARR